MKAVIFVIVSILIILLVGLLVDFLFVGAIMWALVKLEIIASWTWGQALLCTFIFEAITSIFWLTPIQRFI